MILYLHGFTSSPQSFKAQALGGHLRARGLGDHFVCPQQPVEPLAALALAEQLVADHGAKVSRGETASSTGWRDVTIVGSSLGGFYATVLAERHGCQAIMINPAVLAAHNLSQFVGPQRWLYTGESFELTAEHIAQLRMLQVERITRPERYWLLAEEGDQTCDYRYAVTHYPGARQTILPGGDHSFTRWHDYLDDVLRFSRLT